MVSVIIPTFNRSPFLKKAIESVLSQTYQDFELIIVDDGSTDDTPRLASNFGQRIIYVRQERKGPANARNIGIKKSARPLIAFLDSDDWWDEEKLAIQFHEMQQNPGYLISHTEEAWYKSGKLLNQKKKHKKYNGYIFDKCLPLCVVSISTAMVRRGLFDKVGLFDEAFPCCEDYDFWLRASVKHEFLLIDKPLTLKDGGRPDQVSSIFATGIDKFRIHSILKLLKSTGLNPEQCKLATHQLCKKCLIYGTGCIKHGKVEEGNCYLAIRSSHFNNVEM
jgi:glycosyltransferase involved in cell wall biosynthesis